MILCSGVFDGVHAGHVGYLHAAHAFDKTQALVVAVASDAYVVAHKGRAPRYALADRMKVVHALEGVTWVTAHGDESVADVIRTTKPQIFAKGDDWKDRLPDDVLVACQAVGATIVFVHSGSSVHTSDALPPV